MVSDSIGIKAGSSVFPNDNAYSSVAQLIAPLTRMFRQIYFVVSAVKGATDRTIDDIAREQGRDGNDRNGLDQALRGTPRPYTGVFNTPEVAYRLVQPEMESARRLAGELRARGIDTTVLEHGPTYPLLGVDNHEYLFATPDIEASYELQRQQPEQVQDDHTRVVVVPGFGVRNQRGEVMCTGRGSSDLTLVQIAEVYGLPEIVFWKDTGGFWARPNQPRYGIIEGNMSRAEALERRGEKVLDERTYAFPGHIRITEPGKYDCGTRILPPENPWQFDEAMHRTA
ncbi:TPA: hypothetical protein HA249_07435 [Candidatus Woesearchaeota archaeon]|nr:hypothetical protein [Candidatus Woesearchaeota archaeon]